jgi:hypothetical protein
MRRRDEAERERLMDGCASEASNTCSGGVEWQVRVRREVKVSAMAAGARGKEDGEVHPSTNDSMQAEHLLTALCEAEQRGSGWK